MTTPAKKDTKFNPSLGGAFENAAFGKDSILLNITEENYNTLMENVRVGSALVFRFNKVTVKGNKHYFSEILPPIGPKGAIASKVKPAASDLD